LDKDFHIEISETHEIYHRIFRTKIPKYIIPFEICFLELSFFFLFYNILFLLSFADDGGAIALAALMVGSGEEKQTKGQFSHSLNCGGCEK